MLGGAAEAAILTRYLPVIAVPFTCYGVTKPRKVTYTDTHTLTHTLTHTKEGAGEGRGRGGGRESSCAL